MGIIKNILELIKVIPQNKRESFVENCQETLQRQKRTMLFKSEYILNTKVYLYQRQIKYSVRGIIIGTLVFYITKYYFSVTNSIIHTLILFTALVVLSCKYQFIKFVNGLYGYDINDTKGLLRCSYGYLTVTILTELLSVAYLLKNIIGIELRCWLISFSVLFFVLYFIKMIKLRYYNICRVDKLDLKTDIKIEYITGRIRDIDLTKHSLRFTKDNDILIPSYDDDYIDDAEKIKKETIRYIYVKEYKIFYKQGKWKKSSHNGIMYMV